MPRFRWAFELFDDERQIPRTGAPVQFQSVGDTVTFTEGLTGGVLSDTLTEDFDFTESLGAKKTTGTQPAETLGVSESLTAVANRKQSPRAWRFAYHFFDDELRPQATTSVPGTASLADTVTFTETLSRQVRKVINENTSFAEALNFQISRAISEAVTLTEADAILIGRQISETASLTESLATLGAKVFSGGDTVTLTETQVRQIQRALAESPTLTENLKFTISRAISETVTLGEYQIQGREFLEAAALAENFSAVVVEARQAIMNEAADLAERLGFLITRSFSEPLELSESLTATKVTPQRPVVRVGRWVDTQLDTIAGYDDPNVMGTRPYGGTVWAQSGQAASSWTDNELHKITTYGGQVTMGGRPYGGTKWTETR